MDSGKLNDWMQVIGIFALVASLIFVGLQIRQTKEIALNEAGYSSVSSNVEIHVGQNEYADIWVRGNADEDLTRIEESIYGNLLRDRTNRAFFQSNAYRRLGSDADIPTSTFIMFLHQNPGARSRWLKNNAELISNRKALFPGYEPSAWGLSVHAGLNRLDQLDPD